MAAAAKMAGKGKPTGKPATAAAAADPQRQGQPRRRRRPRRAAVTLGKLDPETRAMILKMPPSSYREELIRGLNEQGPEAYRAFIQNYFKQLTEKREEVSRLGEQASSRKHGSRPRRRPAGASPSNSDSAGSSARHARR